MIINGIQYFCAMNKAIENNDMDQMIRNALASDEALRVPDGFAEMAIRRLGKRALLRRLFLELFSKIGLVLLSLMILLGVLAFVNGVEFFNTLAEQILSHKEILISVTIVGAITLLIDQVVIKYNEQLIMNNEQ